MSEENLSPWQKYKKNLGQTRPWDFVKSDVEYAEESVATERMGICNSCPELFKLTTQCKKCGCFMNLKTKLKLAQCPLGKW
jgi:hypothetical protein